MLSKHEKVFEDFLLGFTGVAKFLSESADPVDSECSQDLSDNDGVLTFL